MCVPEAAQVRGSITCKDLFYVFDEAVIGLTVDELVAVARGEA